MNRDVVSYQLPHIDDYLLSAIAAPGGLTTMLRHTLIIFARVVCIVNTGR